MKKSSDMLDEFLCMAKVDFPKIYDVIEKKALQNFEDLCKSNNQNKKIAMHTVEKIYPCIAFYKAIQGYTGQGEKAYAIIDTYFTKECSIVAGKLQKICKIPFVYKIVPKMMGIIINNYFGEKSGFKMVSHQVKGKVCHIDMIACPYHSACQQHGCPELTTVFCDSDDITYGNMHPKISWGRKKTLGRGDDLCDFVLRIKK